MILTPEQQARLDDASTEYGQLLAARIEAKAVGRRAELAHIADQQLRWEISAARYAATGAPKSQLRALTTKNPRTVDEAITSGSRFVKEEPKPVEPEAPTTTPRFQSYAPNGVLVTLQPEDFEPFKSGFPDGIPAEEQDWVFYLEEGILKPASADDDETWLHPVVKVAMSNKMRPEILEFIESQGRG